MKTKDKVAIGWCDPGVVDGEFAVNLTLLGQERRDRIGTILRVEGSALISRQRNELVTNFLDNTTDTWLLMVDADEVLTTATFDKLVAAAHDKDRPIVGGLYFGAWDNDGLIPTPVPIMFRMQGMKYATIHDYPADTLIDVDAAGTGCLLIHRRVFEAFRADATEDEGPNWCFFQDGPVAGSWHGEDMLFCLRARAAGFPIVVHTGATLPHRKRFWMTEKHHQVLRSANAADA